jgi:glycosyltransferase involved in cell wall biosynthesis
LYPAQFWPHKRHVLLLKAFKIVCEQNREISLVLTGGDKGNLNHVMNVVSELGLDDRVVFTGFVESSMLVNLMKTAHCVVFPSQLGPSNMPPIEAALLGTPSIVSSVHADIKLNNPLIQTVRSQSPEDWAARILSQVNIPKSSGHNLERGENSLIQELFDSIQEFKNLRNEWSSKTNRPYKRI